MYSKIERAFKYLSFLLRLNTELPNLISGGDYFPVGRKAASNNNFLLHFIYFSLSGQYLYAYNLHLAKMENKNLLKFVPTFISKS
jgi:hypothetical protein